MFYTLFRVCGTCHVHVHRCIFFFFFFYLFLFSINVHRRRCVTWSTRSDMLSRKLIFIMTTYVMYVGCLVFGIWCLVFLLWFDVAVCLYIESCFGFIWSYNKKWTMVPVAFQTSFTTSLGSVGLHIIFIFLVNSLDNEWLCDGIHFFHYIFVNRFYLFFFRVALHCCIIMFNQKYSYSIGSRKKKRRNISENIVAFSRKSNEIHVRLNLLVQSGIVGL